MNGNIRQNCNNAKCGGAALSLFNSPTSTVLIVECANKYTYTGNESYNINDPNLEIDDTNNNHMSYIAFNSQDGNDGHPAIGDTYQNVKQPAFHDQDGGSLNYLAFDGHVKYLRSTAVSGARPVPAGVNANGDNNNCVANSSLTPYVMTYSVIK